MVITTTDIQLFQILKERLGEKEAEALVNFVDSRLKENNEQNLKIVSTKEDVANLRTEMADNKAEIIKWMFIFWIGTVGVLSWLMVTLFNVYIKH